MNDRCEISRTEFKKAPGLNNQVMEEKQLRVVGDNLEEVKKVFDEEWKK
jgi:hypothetical protein